MDFWDTLANRPYLDSNLISLAVTLALTWLFAWPQRRMVLLAGAVALPFFPLALLFDGEYWTPQRLFSLPVGIEDALYTFVLGARPWLFATIGFPRRYAAHARLAGFARNAAVTSAVALLVYAVLVAGGLGYTLPSMLVPALLLAGLLLRRPYLWPLAFFGGLGTFVIGTLELRLWFALWPKLAGWWTPGTPWSQDFFGVPFGDALWLAVVGATHPIVLASFCDVRLRGAGNFSEASQPGAATPGLP